MIKSFSVLLLTLFWLLFSGSVVAEHVIIETRSTSNCKDGRCKLVPRNRVRTFSFNGSCILRASGRDGVPGSWVITVAHGFDGAGSPRVFNGVAWKHAELIRIDKQRDLALLWVSDFVSTAIPLASVDPPDGEVVQLMVFDFQDGSRFKRIPGKINVRNDVSSSGILRWYFQQGVRQGYSGGALIYNGELIGILSLGDEKHGVVIQRDSIRKFLSIGSIAKSSPVEKAELAIKESNNETKQLTLEITALREQITIMQSAITILSSQERRVILKDSDGNVTADKSYKMHEPIVIRGVFKARKE